MQRSIALLGIVLAALITALGAWFVTMASEPIVTSPAIGTTTSATSSPEAAAARSTVTSFGLMEQRVQLLAPEASSTIATSYGPYVAQPLLARWQADPSSAPGRVTSSPWPDHIVVGDIRYTTEGFEITGMLVLMSNEAVAHGSTYGSDPVLIDLAKHDGRWLITNYEDQSQAAASSTVR